MELSPIQPLHGNQTLIRESSCLNRHHIQYEKSQANEIKWTGSLRVWHLL
jgi:hypothetical protein